MNETIYNEVENFFMMLSAYTIIKLDTSRESWYHSVDLAAA